MKRVTFEVDYTPEDYYFASLVHIGRHKYWQLALGAIFLITAAFEYAQYPITAFIFFILGIYFFVHYIVGLRLHTARIFKGLDLHTRNHFVIDDSGVENKYGHGGSKHAWTEILDIRSNRNILLLYISKYQFFIIPKRAMPETDWKELSAIKVTVRN